MKKVYSIVVAIFLSFSLLGWLVPTYVFFPKPDPAPELRASEETNLEPSIMQIMSPAFLNNQTIPLRYTCDGENVNPPLSVRNLPPDTVSYALIMNDPDAPNSDWVHWLVWNIPPHITEINGASLPPQGSTEGITNFGKTGYGGPCPPTGEHRYFFKLYALDTILKLDSSAKKSELLKAMQGHILKKSELIGVYKREV